MKWLLILFFPFCLQAQTLKPGVYKDLKPTECLLLDTGSYTFIGLEMKDLGKGPWLDARNARKLELLYCTFEGKDEGTAVLSSGDLSVSQCMFTNMKEGIVQASPPGLVRKVSVVPNVFRDNLTSIRLDVKDRNMEKSHGRIENPMIGVPGCKPGTADCSSGDCYYTVQVKQGSTVKLSRTIHLYNPSPPEVLLDHSTVSCGRDVHFTINNFESGLVYKWEYRETGSAWQTIDDPDGGNLLTFNAKKSGEMRVTSISQSNCTQSAIVNLSVNENVEFEILPGSDIEICSGIPLSIHFTSLASEVGYSVDFEDNNAALMDQTGSTITQVPFLNGTNPTTVVYTVTAYRDGCQDSFPFSGTIKVNPTTGSTVVTALCQDEKPVIKIPGLDNEYTLNKPGGSSIFGKDFDLSSTWADGLYTFTINHPTAGCANGQFKVMGGINAPFHYDGSIHLSGTTFILNNIQIGSITTGTNSSLTLSEDARVYLNSVGLEQAGDLNNPDSEYFGGTVLGSNILLGIGTGLSVARGASFEGICGMWGKISALNENFVSLTGTQAKPIKVKDSFGGILIGEGSYIESDWVEFRNNIRNIYDLNYSGSVQSQVTNCLFTGLPEEMKPPFAVVINGYGDHYRSYGWSGIECQRPNYTSLVNNTFERLHYGMKVSGPSTAIEDLNLVNNTFRDCFLAGIVSRHANVHLQGCLFSYPDKREPNHQHYREKLFQSPVYLDLEAADEGNDEGNYPYGLFFRDGDLGSLTLEGSDNFFNGFYSLNGVDERFRFLRGNAIRLSSTMATLEGSKFDKWKYAIRFRNVPSNSGIPRIKTNVFNANARAIEVAIPNNTSLNLDLSCNVFEHRYPDPNNPGDFITFANGIIDPIGINVMAGGELANAGKFDMNATSPPFYIPGANVFPADVLDRTQLPASGDVENTTDGWSSPIGWTSISNGNGNIPRVFRWANEFFGRRFPMGTSNEPLITMVNFLAVPLNAANFDPQTQKKVECENFDVSALFPARIAVVSSAQEQVVKSKSFLGQSIPNPAGANNVLIPYGIEVEFSKAQIEVFEISTGKRLRLEPVNENTGSISISTSSLASGVYGYRLLVDGKSLETKKMVIIR